MISDRSAPKACARSQYPPMLAPEKGAVWSINYKEQRISFRLFFIDLIIVIFRLVIVSPISIINIKNIIEFEMLKSSCLALPYILIRPLF